MRWTARRRDAALKYAGWILSIPEGSISQESRAFEVENYRAWIVACETADEDFLVKLFSRADELSNASVKLDSWYSTARRQFADYAADAMRRHFPKRFYAMSLDIPF